MSYHHGRFVWFECFTKDIERARSFYSELFNWKVEPMKMADGSTYQLIKSGDVGIGGLMPLQPPQGDHPFWLSYLSVSDVDETAKKLSAQGGKVLHEGFDVGGVGRIAIVQDAQGSAFALFKAATQDPTPAEGPGSWWWNELHAKDGSAAVAFYEKVFGYTHDTMDGLGDVGPYYLLKQGEQMRGGIMKSPMPGAPPAWLPYVHVSDCDQTAERAKKMGGQVHSPPTDIPTVGRFSVLSDPTGAVIAAIKPAS